MELSSSKKLLEKGVRLMSALALTAIIGVMPMTAAAEEAAPEQPVAVEEAAPVEAGDANAGRALFTGETRFANGGPACMSCHSAGVGALNGGILGPDLTKAYVDESKNPLLSTAWVNGGGSPTMGPIFAAKNITEAEMENLRAFLKNQGAKEVASSQSATFAGIGILGFVAILILFTIIWSGRYSKRTRNTAHDALWRNYGGKGGI